MFLIFGSLLTQLGLSGRKFYSRVGLLKFIVVVTVSLAFSPRANAALGPCANFKPGGMVRISVKGQPLSQSAIVLEVEGGRVTLRVMGSSVAAGSRVTMACNTQTGKERPSLEQRASMTQQAKATQAPVFSTHNADRGLVNVAINRIANIEPPSLRNAIDAAERAGPSMGLAKAYAWLGDVERAREIAIATYPREGDVPSLENLDEWISLVRRNDPDPKPKNPPSWKNPDSITETIRYVHNPGDLTLTQRQNLGRRAYEEYLLLEKNRPNSIYAGVSKLQWLVSTLNRIGLEKEVAVIYARLSNLPCIEILEGNIGQTLGEGERVAEMELIFRRCPVKDGDRALISFARGYWSSGEAWGSPSRQYASTTRDWILRMLELRGITYGNMYDKFGISAFPALQIYLDSPLRQVVQVGILKLAQDFKNLPLGCSRYELQREIAHLIRIYGIHDEFERALSRVFSDYLALTASSAGRSCRLIPNGATWDWIQFENAVLIFWVSGDFGRAISLAGRIDKVLGDRYGKNYATATATGIAALWEARKYPSPLPSAGSDFEAKPLGIPFLKFPIQDKTPESAVMNSVMDHSVEVDADGPMFYSNKRDGVVVAYTGEQGEKDCEFNEDCVIDAPETPSYKLSTDGNFIVNGNYKGGGHPDYLSYDGHSGYDYREGRMTPIQAPADGVVYIPEADPITLRKDPAGAVSRFAVLAIDHENGYTSWFLHLGDSAMPDDSGDFRRVRCPSDAEERLIRPGEEIRVHQGCQIGYVGNKGVKPFHLHYELRKGVSRDDKTGKRLCVLPACVPVDPYGWAPVPNAPVQRDPYSPFPGGSRLWLN